MNNDKRTTRELALEWWNSWLTPEESLAQENKELKEENKLLREALKDLIFNADPSTTSGRIDLEKSIKEAK